MIFVPVLWTSGLIFLPQSTLGIHKVTQRCFLIKGWYNNTTILKTGCKSNCHKPIFLKPLNFYLPLSRPINGMAMNCAIIDVGFSQQVKGQQKCGFSQIKPFKHLRLKAEIKYIDNDNLICTLKTTINLNPINYQYL